jgi:site-specific recombinase XerD
MNATSDGWEIDVFVASLTAASGHTRDAYDRDVRQFVAWADRGGCSDPARLDHATLRRYLAYLTTRGFAKRSIARKAAALRAYLRFLRRHGVVTADPGRTLRAPKGPSRLPRVPRAGDARALLDGAQVASATSAEDPRVAAVARRDLAVLEVLYGAGLRVAECCGLTFADCDLSGGALTVLGKGSKARRVPLGEPGRLALCEYVELARPVLATGESPPAAVFLNGGSPHATPAASSPVTACRTARCSTRTCCATPSPRTSSKAAPTCGSSRSCSATPISRRPRSTRT